MDPNYFKWPHGKLSKDKMDLEVLDNFNDILDCIAYSYNAVVGMSNVLIVRHVLKCTSTFKFLLLI